MNTHPIEYLPAYVLGALDQETAHLVELHLRQCWHCRSEADAFRQHIASVDAAHIPAPPAHIKHALMLRVHAADNPDHHAARTWLSRPAMNLLAAGGLTLALLFGAMMVNAQRQRDAAQQALQALQSTNQGLSEQQLVAFLSSPNTVAQELTGPHAGATARMYMQPGQHHAVLVVSGMPKAAPGTTYQFWFATTTQQIPAGTFAVDASGTARAVFDAPAPVDSYGEVMVTVEPAGGSRVPSSNIVLAAKLAAVSTFY